MNAAGNHGLQRRPRVDVIEVDSRSRGPAEPYRSPVRLGDHPRLDTFALLQNCRALFARASSLLWRVLLLPSTSTAKRHAGAYPMQNPYQPSAGVSNRSAPSTPDSGLALRAVLLSPVATFVISLVLAAMAGIFIALFGAALSDANGESTIIFDAIFMPTFVWLPYLLCGYLAGRIAGFRHVFHALCAGCVYLVASVGMSLPWDLSDSHFWTHMTSFALIIPLALIGGKLSERW